MSDDFNPTEWITTKEAAELASMGYMPSLPLQNRPK
jgi:hypothetical protein